MWLKEKLKQPPPTIFQLGGKNGGTHIYVQESAEQL